LLFDSLFHDIIFYFVLISVNCKIKFQFALLNAKGAWLKATLLEYYIVLNCSDPYARLSYSENIGESIAITKNPTMPAITIIIAGSINAIMDSVAA